MSCVFAVVENIGCWLTSSDETTKRVASISSADNWSSSCSAGPRSRAEATKRTSSTAQLRQILRAWRPP